MSRFSKFGRVSLIPAAAIVCAVALPGCGSKLTQENFAAIRPDMSEADVIKLLGKPTSTENSKGLLGDMTKDVWKDGNKSITVEFVTGRILSVEKAGF